MGEWLSGGLLLPAIMLALMGWLVPQGLARIMPEGVGALMLLAFVATVLLAVLASALFMALYIWRGAPVAEVVRPAAWPAFGRLALLSALIWAPVMVLSVSTLPRRWTGETW